MRLIIIFSIFFIFFFNQESYAKEAKSWLKKEIDIIISAYQNTNLPNENKFLMKIIFYFNICILDKFCN